MISRIGYSPKVQTLKNNINSKNNSVTNPSTSIETTKAFEFPKFANVYFMGENNLSKAKSDEIILTDYPKHYRDFETGNSIFEQVLPSCAHSDKKIILREERDKNHQHVKDIYTYPNSTKKRLEYIYGQNSNYLPIEAVRYDIDGETPIYKESYKYYTPLNDAIITCESLDGYTEELDEPPMPIPAMPRHYLFREFPKTGVKIETLYTEEKKPILYTTHYDASGKITKRTESFPGSTEIKSYTIYNQNERFHDNKIEPLAKTLFYADLNKSFDEISDDVDEVSSVIDKFKYPKKYIDTKTGENVTEKIITDENGQPEIHTTYKKAGRLTKEAFSYPETTKKQIEKVYDSKGNLAKETYYNEEGHRDQDCFYENGEAVRSIGYYGSGAKHFETWKYGKNDEGFIFYDMYGNAVEKRIGVSLL